MSDPLLVRALDEADALLADHYEGVDEWWMGEIVDHVYKTCPALTRTGRTPSPGTGRLYPEAGDVCGWCVRVWKARSRT